MHHKLLSTSFRSSFVSSLKTLYTTGIIAIITGHARTLNYNNNLLIATKLQNGIDKNTASEKTTLHLLLK